MINSIIFDTNVIVRYFVKDPPFQLIQAQRYIEKIEQGKLKGLLSVLVINEIVWVLEKYYSLKRAIYVPLLLKLLALKNIRIIEVKKNLIVEALELMFSRNVDFTDAYLFCSKGDRKIFSRYSLDRIY